MKKEIIGNRHEWLNIWLQNPTFLLKFASSCYVCQVKTSDGHLHFVCYVFPPTLLFDYIYNLPKMTSVQGDFIL